MSQITDVEAKGYYEENILKKSHREVFDTLVAGTREHSRILLPWNEKLPEYNLPKIMDQITFEDTKKLFTDIYFSGRDISRQKIEGEKKL